MSGADAVAERRGGVAAQHCKLQRCRIFPWNVGPASIGHPGATARAMAGWKPRSAAIYFAPPRGEQHARGARRAVGNGTGPAAIIMASPAAAVASSPAARYARDLLHPRTTIAPRGGSPGTRRSTRTSAEADVGVTSAPAHARHRTAPHRPHRTAPHRTAPSRTAPHRTAPHRAAPHRAAPHETAPSEATPDPAPGVAAPVVAPAVAASGPSQRPQGQLSARRGSLRLAPVAAASSRRPQWRPAAPVSARSGSSAPVEAASGRVPAVALPAPRVTAASV